MENNIFYKNSKKKFNPDIKERYTNKEIERTCKYNLNTIFYNPITNIVPPKIESTQDLILNNEINNNNLQKILMDKEKDRNHQDKEYTFINNKLNIFDQNANNSISTFNDLKQLSNNTNSTNNIHKYNNILVDLKTLGIII